MALVLTVVAQVELAALHRDPAGETVGAYSFDVALALVTTLPLAFRRWFPAAVPTAVFAVHVLANVMFAHAQSFFSFTTALAVLSYTIGRHAAPRAAGVGWILGAAWVATFWIHTPGFRDPGSFAFGAAVMVLPWAAGWTISELHTHARAWTGRWPRSPRPRSGDVTARCSRSAPGSRARCTTCWPTGSA